MVETALAMRRWSIFLFPWLPLFLVAGSAAGCVGGVHTLRYAPAEGHDAAVEADILRQSPTGLISVTILGTARVVEARGDTRRISFEVESAVVTDNGRPIDEGGHLGALTRMAGVELRFILDREGRLLGQPVVHGARDAADAAVHAAVLDDLIQAGGAFASHGVDVGESWSHPWALHGFAGAEIDGELRSTLSSHDGTVAEVELSGSLDMPRQELAGGWLVEGSGRARGHSRIALPAGTTIESFISIRADTSARSPDGIESASTVVAELWLRHPAGAASPPPESLLACQGRLVELAAPTLSLGSEAEDSTFARRPGARITSAQGAPIDAPGTVVRLEAGAAFIDGVPTADVRLWAHESEEARGIVYVDIAPEVTVARVAEVIEEITSPRLLVGAEVETVDVASLVAPVEAMAGPCTAASSAARLAADDDLLRPAFSFVHGVRAAIGSCGCAVGDLDGMLALVQQTAGGLVGSLRFLPLDAASLRGAPADARAQDLPRLLAAPAASPTAASASTSAPAPTEDSK